ncbi:hypothetical protein Y1Q_0004006 [Alligator mississippiensis]|uniref:Uncharacterized protein n=1 Tax=Alligator mississippiensis TaxID=8496 RepID=A0A151PHN9_ALLMI|nr:hypothetical protein Y1Q_0004006 [Alligator mississippiensis]
MERTRRNCARRRKTSTSGGVLTTVRRGLGMGTIIRAEVPGLQGVGCRIVVPGCEGLVAGLWHKSPAWTPICPPRLF